jgi:Domain of unknown function (DUF4390)
MRRAFAIVMTIALTLLSPSPSGAQTIQITPLARDGHLLVTFNLTDGFNDEVRAAIHSGMNITFQYQVDLRRSTTLWLDRTIASAVVSASVRYDTLTRKYYFTRIHDGRTEFSETTDNYDAVRQWLTDFEKLPLFTSSTLERNTEYYVRVRATKSPRNTSFIWPWGGHDVMGQVKFTFLPR